MNGEIGDGKIGGSEKKLAFDHNIKMFPFIYMLNLQHKKENSAPVKRTVIFIHLQQNDIAK